MRKITSEAMDANARKEKRAAILKFIALIAVLIGIPLYIFLAKPDWIALFRDKEALEAFLNLHERHTAIILFAFEVLQIVIAFIPGQAAQFASGYACGILRGFLICTAGVIVGTVISYSLAKLLGRDFVYNVFRAKEAAEIEAKIRSKRAHTLVFLLYLIPMLPKDAVAYVSGAAGYPLRTLLLISTVARTPAMVLGIAMGAELRSGNHTALLVLLAVSVALLIFCIVKREKIQNFANKCLKNS